MGCACAKAAEIPPELVGVWARDPWGSMGGLMVVRRKAYARVNQGFVALDLGSPNELLEIPQRGIVRSVQTLGGGSYKNLWTGPVTEWNAGFSPGNGEYTTETCCCGTLESVGQPQLESGLPWTLVSGEPIHSILVNGQTRLYRVTKQI